jgi:hypothetical protein
MGKLRTGEFRIYAGTDDTATSARIIDGDIYVNTPHMGDAGTESKNANRGSTTNMIMTEGVALHVKCVDSWTEGSDWGGYLQIVSEMLRRSVADVEHAGLRAVHEAQAAVLRDDEGAFLVAALPDLVVGVLVYEPDRIVL